MGVCHSAAVNEDQLEVSLDVDVPREIAVGAGTTLFLYGACWHPSREMRGLEVQLGERRSAVEEFGMPRRDIYIDAERARLRSLDPESDWMPPYAVAATSIGEPPRGSPSYRSGFWAFVDIPPIDEPKEVEIGLRALLEDGRASSAQVRTTRLAPAADSDWVQPPPQTPSEDEPLVVICMATFNPEMTQFTAQVRSIEAQTHRNWICVVSDDDSREEVQREMAALLAADARFVFRPQRLRLGFYRNFERALAAVPPHAEYVALSDQDDRWYPEKLETLVASAADHQLVFSDMRVIDDAGTVLTETFWDHRPNNTTELDRLLLMNTVTGAASLFRRELLDLVLPFPPRIGPRAIHDQWIAAVALATGRIGFVAEPLHDYVQHRSSVLGHPTAHRSAQAPGATERARRLIFGQREIYFGDYCRLQVVARTLLLRCEPGMEAGKARAVRRLLRLGSPAGIARLSMRALTPRSRSASFGEERKLLRSVAWPPMLKAAMRTRMGRRFDANMPQSIRDALEVQPEAPPGIGELRHKTRPLRLDVSDREPTRINVLIPGIDVRGFFGGYIGIFNLTRRLRVRGASVRLVCFERGNEHLPPGWRDEIERFSGLAGFFDEVEVETAPAAGDRIAVSPQDRFVATTWWSAHIADAAVRELGRERFLYLIQDYEPLFYPMGTWHALAEQTYSFPHFALFSTDLLREFFRSQRLGVFSDPDADGVTTSVAFENAITPVTAPRADDLQARERRRLLFYARLESYSPRNLFDLGLLALMDLIEDGVIDDRWDLYGVGSVGGPARFELGEDRELVVLPRQEEGSYAEFLRRHDLGISLMHSPHPSLVPLEMASAGMITVTNSYMNKTPEALAKISPNLIAGEPTRDGVRDALREACAAVDDFERRVAGASVRWPTTWDAAIDAALVDQLEAFLSAC
jgi:hypothetical protein